jgi:hypothetical protein
MFGNQADHEALYNFPDRPVFGVVGFYFFLAGVIIAFAHWREPRYAFLLIWLFFGSAPAFASNPPGSLSHTITALPVVYILAALPATHWRNTQPTLRVGLALICFGSIALRDLPDYFIRWPSHPEVRYLYRAELRALTNKLHNAPPATYVLNGELSKWDRLALLLDGPPFESPPRWVRAEWAMVFPTQPATYLFTPADWQTDAPPAQPFSIHFSNDLIFEGWTQMGSAVITHWRVGPDYRPVEPEVGSYIGSPPFPAFIFLHLLDASGEGVAGSDRFDADAYALQPGDRFLQRHLFESPPGEYQLAVGLYDPLTGARYTTTAGQDAIQVGSVQLP